LEPLLLPSAWEILPASRIFQSTSPNPTCGEKRKRGQKNKRTSKPTPKTNTHSPAQVSPQEIRAVVAAYKDKGDPSTGVKKVQASGLHVAGERYIVLKADERSLYGRKVCISCFQKPPLSKIGRFLVGKGGL